MTQNRIIALVLAMIVAVPLLAAPADRNLTGIAAMTLELFALVLMTALLWRAKWDLRAESVSRFLKTSANLPILMLLGLMTVSCVFSPVKLFSIQELLRTGAGILLYFVVAYQFRQSKHLSLLVGVLLPLSAIVAVGGMISYQVFAQDRASAIFGNSQPLASFTMLLLPVIVSLACTDKNPTRRLASIIVSVLMVGCLMLTQGRSAWVGAVAGLLMLAFLVKRSMTSAQEATPLRARKHQLVLPILAAVIAVGFLAITKSQNTTIDSRAIAAVNLSQDGSFQSRVESWKGAVAMIAAKPLTGWGTGLYPVYQHQFTGKGVAIENDGRGMRVSLAEQAHNFYLQTAAELGLPGLLLTLATFVAFLAAGLRRVGSMEAGIRRTLLMGSMASTIAFLVDAFASPSWQYGQTAMFLWLLMGVGTSCLRPRAKREEVEAVESHVTSRRFALISRPVAACLFLSFVTLLPTGYSSAQSFNYNGNNGKHKGQTKKIIFGSAVGLGLIYFLSTLSDSVVAGVGAGGAAGTGGGAGGSSTAPGTGGVNPEGPNLSSSGGDATNAGSGTSSDPMGADTRATPTPTPMMGG